MCISATIVIERRFGLFATLFELRSVQDKTRAVSWDGLQKSSTNVGAELKRQLDVIDEGIRRNKKTPSEVYPANKISVICGGCKERVGAGEGYSHYLIGTRKFFCRHCHLGMGLPLRDGDIVTRTASVIIDGEEGNNEV